MYENGNIYMGITDTETPEKVYLNLGLANRHGLISGATGTGKTITMKVMAESFSSAGVPVFLCDVKGDVSGICEPGADNEGMQKRIDRFGIRDTFKYRSYPTCFWDIFGKGGHPVRTTVSDMGPALLSRILGLSEAQEGVLNVVFRVADDKGLLILDLKDLRAVLNFVSEHRNEISIKYGNVASASINTILRAIIPLEDKGGDLFFGEPALDILDWMRTDSDGRGYINVLHAVDMIQTPEIYSMFLLWLMAELFERLPEVGDGEKPKLVFFFDEAHLLFSDASKTLVSKIEQTVKLIRSKGVGIYFVTQSPRDIPDSVLAQLSNKIQHGLRAYTPAEQKAVKAAAQGFRANPDLDTEKEILNLGTGEALTSFLDAKGVPGIVQKTKIICPESLMAPCMETTRNSLIQSSVMNMKYKEAVDNISAYEKLEEQSKIDSEKAELERQKAELEKQKAELEKQKAKEAEKAAAKKEKEEEKKKAKKERMAESRKKKIESQLISAGGQVLKRGLFSILKSIK